MTTTATAPLEIAVITGGHNYDVVNFHRIFRAFPELNAYIQHVDDFCSASEEMRDHYDVLVFYSMMRPVPSDEGLPWYAGKPATVLGRLGKSKQGIVLLHHALCAYLEWPTWDKLTGIDNRRDGFAFHLNQTLDIHVADPDHPITRGLEDWQMTDETYQMPEPGPDSHPLLTTGHDLSMRTLAWVHDCGKSRVFCLQSGHDRNAWHHPSFRQLLYQGILWAGNRPAS